MPRRLLLWCVPTLVLALAAPASPQDPVAPPSEKDAALQAWARAAEPGPWHAFLAQRAGKWRIAGRIWNDPRGEPAQSTSTARLEMILGGRFLQEVVKGETGGRKFQGLGLLGCDNADGTITAQWFDSLSTMTTVLRGPAGEPGQPVELRGSLTDPATGRTLNLRVILTFVNPNEHRWDYYGSPEGFDEARLMELIYTRQ